MWDADENRYIDYVLGNGPAFLGLTPTAVLDAVRDPLDNGQALTRAHRADMELAERLIELIPCAERVRFDVSRTQAGHIALRLARAHTGCPRIVKFERHCHGGPGRFGRRIRVGSRSGRGGLRSRGGAWSW